MVDGKVCNSLMESSGMECYLCRAKISQMNNITALRMRTLEPEGFKFGLSVLHAYIRFFDCLLHISYRLEIRTWKIPKAQQNRVQQRKHVIQQKFRQTYGLLVDVPKQNYGTSNDGNTARRFFANPKLSSEITGMTI
nr:uncharacterized protein LOC111418582 [Onthophagus taurus]